MHLISIDTAWQLAADKRTRMMGEASRRRRVRPRPPVDHLPRSTPPDAA
jgi:hypothetical protein